MEFLSCSGIPKAESPGRPCWPIIWLWVLSISQYGYRYILQVNDVKDSPQYGPTPAVFSAIKYKIFVLFVLYSLCRCSRRPAFVSSRYRVLGYLTGGSLLLLSMVFFLRMIAGPGELGNTVINGVQLVPWISIVFFMPLVFDERHSLARTLLVFERVVFWIVFPFWLTTVALVIFGIRYPALSYPGLIVRFGGILDDPNANAGVSLFLLVLSATFRQGAWKTRTTIYALMLLGTLSFSGYIMGLVLCGFLLVSPFTKSARQFRQGALKLCAKCVIASCVLAGIVAIYEANTVVIDAVNSLYSAKAGSTGTHISNLFPSEAMFDVSSPITALFGPGGYSENFYWRILINFGWIGFLILVSLVALWTYEALLHAKDWRYSLGGWAVAVLIASNGIAYVLLFPVSLLLWSILSLLVLHTANPQNTALNAQGSKSWQSGQQAAQQPGRAAFGEANSSSRGRQLDRQPG